MAELIPCRRLDYFELGADRLVASVTVGADTPARAGEAARALAFQRPTSPVRLSPRDGAVRLSDRISRRDLLRLDFYQEAMLPLGVQDELVLLLRTGRRVCAGFSFEGTSRFSDRDRLVLDLLAPHLTRLLNSGAPNGGSSRADVPLTEREWEVLGWIAQGETDKQIARRLFIAPRTVRKHVENSFAKLGVHTRTAAVARAFRANGG